MKGTKKVLISLLAVIFTLASCTCLAKRISVVVTISPEKYFVEQIGRELVDVSCLMPAEADPHTYEPKPGDLIRLNHSDIYIAMGTLSMERKWIPRFVKMFPKLRIVSLFEGISALYGLQNNLMAPEGFDPHIWLSPSLVMLESRVIYSELNRLLTGKQKAILKKNYELWIKRLADLDIKLMDKFHKFPKAVFLTYHPAWTYFARSYGLIQISIEREGKKPGPGELMNISKKVKKNNIKTIFVHSNPPPLAARNLASMMNLSIKVINPLAIDWEGNMIRVAELLEESFRKQGM